MKKYKETYIIGIDHGYGNMKTPASYLRIKPMDKRQAEIQICLSRLSCRRMYFPCC